MRGFLRDCRHAITVPGLPSVGLVLGVLAGINAHRGVALDILGAVFVACIAWVGAVLGYVLGWRLRQARRRSHVAPRHTKLDRLRTVGRAVPDRGTARLAMAPHRRT